MNSNLKNKHKTGRIIKDDPNLETEGKEDGNEYLLSDFIPVSKIEQMIH